MATRTWVSPVSHSNDAEFRAWGSELSTELDTYLPKTTDTGQINWSTVTRPAANSAAGYEIRRFNDSLQATAPIFIKLEFGTAGNAAMPSIWVTVGTGTNGAGTLTGSVTQRATCTFTLVPGSGGYPSLISSTQGFFGLLWKSGVAAGNGYGFFAIARHATPVGVADGDGFMVVWGGINASTACISQCVRTASPANVFTASNQFALIPGQVVSSAVDADYQAYAVMGINPRVWVVPWLAAVCLADIPDRATFSTALAGSTQRTFISLSSGFRPVVAGTGPGNISSYGLAMVWES